MSAAINDGGPAFPVPGLSGLPNGDFIHPDAGMTLRDHFAAQALNSGMAGNWRDNHYEPKSGLSTIENVARAAYQFADAMLKARSA